MSYKFLDIKVRCPKNYYRVYPMQIIFVTLDDGKNFPFPVNGCDDHNGSDTCQKCCADITLKFYNGYDYHPLDVITPDLSKYE